MKHHSTQIIFAFTIMEMIVIMTIIGIVSVGILTPYMHSQKKAALTRASKDISQSLQHARNMSIHGFDTGSGNLSIGVLLPSQWEYIEIYTSTGTLILSELDQAQLLETKAFPNNVKILSIDGNEDEDYLLSYESISGSWSIEPAALWNRFEVKIWYADTDSDVLQKEIILHRLSHVIDY